ncbi:major facilitator superfamily transporter [Colletotrichum higginsianum]|nr:major facilitator superfamily transporter [Colletotrichum higginsianum]
MLSGILFGWGFNMLFMGMINYLTDVFRQYSASAHAAASMTRSIGAILLPLAADSMYADLGVHWAPSLLGFIALAMGTIPFIFIRFGDRLSRSSKTAREAFAIKD